MIRLATAAPCHSSGRSFYEPLASITATMQHNHNATTERIAVVPMHTIIRPDGSTQNGSIGSNDVLCGRSKEAFNHIGNQRFRTSINNVLDSYRKANSRSERSNIVFSVHDSIRSQGGRFLKRDKNGPWMELTASQTKDKIAHAIRDAVNSSDARKLAKEIKARADADAASKESNPQHTKRLSTSNASTASSTVTSSKNPFADAGGIAPKSESEQFYNKLEETTRKIRERQWANKKTEQNEHQQQQVKDDEDDDDDFMVPEPRPMSLLRQHTSSRPQMSNNFPASYQESPFALAVDSERARMDYINQPPGSFMHPHQPHHSLAGASGDGRIGSSSHHRSALGGYEDIHHPKQDLFDHAFSAGQPVNDIKALQDQGRVGVSCSTTSAKTEDDNDVTMLDPTPLDKEPQDVSLSESAFSKMMGGLHDSDETISDDSFLKCINSLDLSAQDLPSAT